MQRPNFGNESSRDSELSGGDHKILRYASLAAKNDVDTSASSPKSKQIDKIMKIDSGISANTSGKFSDGTRESGVDPSRDTMPLNYFRQTNGLRKERSASFLGLKNNNEDECLFAQIYSIALFYCVGIVCDVMLFTLGFESLNEGYLFCTYDSKVIIVWTEMGALYTFFNSATILFYSWVMY